ncbi:BTP [Musa troglodytarum]|uniref:BTP n=1 Tax=Musa troglodytarum TaxID=320322 RepID=A0A9E7FKH5_9LILI|nr:BTP [Musa troglodytarum]
MAPPQRRRHKEQRRCPPTDPHPPSPPSAFAAALSNVAVAQICLSTGYTAAEPSALGALSDVAGRYILALGRSAAHIAAANGRTDANILDLVRAIEDLSAAHGFAGAADPTGPLLRSGALRGLMAFVQSVDEVPFPRPIRRDENQETPGNQWTSFAAAGREPPFRHVPRWLPCFPEGQLGEEGKGIGTREEVEKERTAMAVTDGEGKKIVELPAERGRVRFRMGGNRKRRQREG